MIESAFYGLPFHEYVHNKDRATALFDTLILSKGLENYRITITPLLAPEVGFSALVAVDGRVSPGEDDAESPRKLTEGAVTFLSDRNTRMGPRAFDQCLSCDPDSARIAESNYEGGEALRGPPGGLPSHLREITTRSCLLSDIVASLNPGSPTDKEPASDAWLDAQGRPLIIVTPRLHVDSMAQLSSSANAHLWATVSSVITHFGTKHSTSAAPSFSKIVLNAGLFRNIAHAHIKVWFHGPDFLSQVDTAWPAARRDTFNNLLELRRLMKLPDRDHVRKSLAYAEAGKIGVIVKGEFEGREEAEEIRAKFARYGTVVDVRYLPDRKASSSLVSKGSNLYEKTENGALVTMLDADAVVEAIYHMNLTRIGRNTSCKLKLGR